MLLKIEKSRRGGMLAQILGCKMRTANCTETQYLTEWGYKTALGIYETARRIIEEGK